MTNTGVRSKFFILLCSLPLCLPLFAFPCFGASASNGSQVRGEWVTPTGKGARADVIASGISASDGLILPPEEEEIVIDVTDEETEKLIIEAKMAQKWLSIEEDLQLRPYDREGMKLVDEFRSARNAPPPAPGEAGAVVITWGTVQPKVICRPLRVTDIQFQPGEKVTNVDVGDSVRWSISPAMSGSGAGVRVHAMIKPLMANISTNLVVNTDRRSYHIELVAQDNNYMPCVVFAYPEEARQQWEAFLTQQRQERADTLDVNVQSPADLNFNYKIEGKAVWKPDRVFDDGTKTYIQMADAMRSTEAPVFMIVRDKKQTIVNYRVHGKFYVVDRIFEKGHLVSGHGAIQERVVISRVSEKIHKSGTPAHGGSDG
jgi:type IV secretion system protein VirB9